MTKKEMFNALREIVIENEEMVAFIDHEIELLDKKSSSARKPTKVQIENENFKAIIISYLTEVETFKSIKEIQAEVPEVAGLSNQRITHLLTALVNANTLNKKYIKKVPYYSISGELTGA